MVQAYSYKNWSFRAVVNGTLLKEYMHPSCSNEVALTQRFIEYENNGPIQIMVSPNSQETAVLDIPYHNTDKWTFREQAVTLTLSENKEERFVTIRIMRRRAITVFLMLKYRTGREIDQLIPGRRSVAEPTQQQTARTIVPGTINVLNNPAVSSMPLPSPQPVLDAQHIAQSMLAPGHGHKAESSYALHSTLEAQRNIEAVGASASAVMQPTKAASYTRDIQENQEEAPASKRRRSQKTRAMLVLDDDGEGFKEIALMPESHGREIVELD